MGRRRLAFGAALLAGCNWIVGIHELPPNDARVTADGTPTTDGATDASGPPCTTVGATRCSGPVLQTCTGDVWQSRTCDFTCAEVGGAGESTCVAASNMSSVAATCGPDPSTWPVLDPGAGGVITYEPGTVGIALACTTGSGSDCGDIVAASMDLSNPPGVAWFCVQSLVIEANAALVVGSDAVPPYALGLVVGGDAQIDGAVTLDGSDVVITNPQPGTIYPGGLGGPGGFAGGSGESGATGIAGAGIDASGGRGGQSAVLFGPHRTFLGGGGGGGNSTAGAAGGSAYGSGAAFGGSGGDVITAGYLVGGGGGGGSTAGTASQFGFPGAGGGGAIQISARGQITISGTISATGGAGFSSNQPMQYAGTGGGAGGMILLEAPIVTAIGTLIVDGGNGGSGYMAPGGNGATGSATAEPGASSTDGQNAVAGGGGGGAGRIVVHGTSPSCPADSSISPTYSCTATVLQGSAE